MDSENEKTAVLEAILEITERLKKIEKKMEEDNIPPLEEITPATHVITVTGETLVDGYQALGLLHLMPANQMNGERTTMPDASLHQCDYMEALVIAVGSALPMIEMTAPKRLLIRSNSDRLLKICDRAILCPEGSKMAMLAADIGTIEAQMGIPVETELVPSNHPEMNTVNSLVNEAKAEYIKRTTHTEKEETADEPSDSGDSTDH